MVDESPKTPTEERSLVPVVLASLVIAGVAGALIFWPEADDARPGHKGGAPAASAAAPAGNTPAGSAALRPREADQAKGAAPAPKFNPAIIPTDLGLAPDGPPPPPPTFNSPAEELAFQEKVVKGAREEVKRREEFVERIPAAKERFAARLGPLPDLDERWREREKTIRDNLVSAKAKLAEQEKKLETLRAAMPR